MLTLLGLTREEIRALFPQEQEIIFLFTGPLGEPSCASIPRAVCLRSRQDKLECILAYSNVINTNTAPSG